MSEQNCVGLIRRLRGALNCIATNSLKIKQNQADDDLDDISWEYLEQIQNIAMTEYGNVVEFLDDG